MHMQQLQHVGAIQQGRMVWTHPTGTGVILAQILSPLDRLVFDKAGNLKHISQLVQGLDLPLTY